MGVQIIKGWDNFMGVSCEPNADDCKGAATMWPFAKRLWTLFSLSECTAEPLKIKHNDEVKDESILVSVRLRRFRFIGSSRQI